MFFSRIVERAAQQKTDKKTLKATGRGQFFKKLVPTYNVSSIRKLDSDGTPLEVLDALDQLPEDHS